MLSFLLFVLPPGLMGVATILAVQDALELSNATRDLLIALVMVFTFGAYHRYDSHATERRR